VRQQRSGTGADWALRPPNKAYLDSSLVVRKLRTTAEVDCSRIFGPVGGQRLPWPRWKFARGEPIA
jgi:hypothetical protein